MSTNNTTIKIQLNIIYDPNYKTRVLPPYSDIWKEKQNHRTSGGPGSYVEANYKEKDIQTDVPFLAPLVGLEPTTCGLTVRRSTDWAKEEY